MSQIKITLPITLEHTERPSRVEPISFRDCLSGRDSAEYRFVSHNRGKHGPFDPWALREDFLTWPAEHWEGFIEMAGSLGTFRISKSDFAEWQTLLKEAILLHPREWPKLEKRLDGRKIQMLLKPLPVRFVWNVNAPEARIAVSGTLPLIIATIQLDVLRGAQFRTCARTDCVNPPFKIEARHKIYCSPECAHLVAVRNSRARAAKRPARRIRQKN